MKLFIERVFFKNRAPFQSLDLNFRENQVAILSAVNGRGKTTILSHIADAFYELAKKNYPNEFHGKMHLYQRHLKFREVNPNRAALD